MYRCATSLHNYKTKKFCPRKFLNFRPRKKEVTPRKNTKMCPRKLQTAREKKIQKGARKNFPSEKKPKKISKSVFSGTFHFLG